MHKYTPEQIEFLRKHYRNMRLPALMEAFNKQFGVDQTESALQNAMSKRGIRSGRKPDPFSGSRAARFTEEQVEFIKNGARSMTIAGLTKVFNEKFGQNRASQSVHSLLMRRGFKSGIRPGMSPNEAKAIGTERVCPSTGFVVVKVDEPDPYQAGRTRYRHKHRVVWEQHNGPIPEGHRVRFIDGDKQNCDIDNLMLFSHAENFHLNLMGFDKAPPELKESIILRARLIAKMAERRQELAEEG